MSVVTIPLVDYLTRKGLQLLFTAAEATKARRVFTLKHKKIGLVMMNTDKKSDKGLWQRLNDAVTEVGVEHADDDFD